MTYAASVDTVSVFRRYACIPSEDRHRLGFLCLVTLTSDLLTAKISELLGLTVKHFYVTASVFEISCGKPDRQTNKHVNADGNHIHATTVGVKIKMQSRRCFLNLMRSTTVSDELITVGHTCCGVITVITAAADRWH